MANAGSRAADRRSALIGRAGRVRRSDHVLYPLRDDIDDYVINKAKNSQEILTLRILPAFDLFNFQGECAPSTTAGLDAL